MLACTNSGLERAPRRRSDLHRDRADRNPCVQPVLLREFPAITDPRRFGRLNARTVDLGDARLGFAAPAFAPFPRNAEGWSVIGQSWKLRRKERSRASIQSRKGGETCGCMAANQRAGSYAGGSFG